MNRPLQPRKKSLVRLALSVGLVAVTVGIYACIQELTDTVFFNNPEVDFGKAPPAVVVSSWGEYANRPVSHDRYIPNDSDESVDDYDTAGQDTAKMSQTIARSLERPDSLLEAAKAWRKLARGSTTTAESARDRAEVLEESQKAGFGPLVLRYLAARDLPPKEGEKELLALAADPSAGFIRPHAFYAIGSALYDQRKPGASEAYERAAAFAKSPRREPALMMAARFELEDFSTTRTPNRIAKARKLIGVLLRERPNSRFRLSAEGWLARADYLSGDRLSALTKYYRALTNETDPTRHLSLLASIRKVTRELKADEAASFRNRLLQDPTLIEPYLNYRLYHTSPSAADLKSLVLFARQAMSSGAGSRVSAGIQARLAEIAYLQGDNASATLLANRSLANSSKVNARPDLATYVKAGVLKRKQDWAGIEKVLVTFEEKYPRSYLVKSAQELLALAYEKQGDFARSVDVFSRLGYQIDVAYLVDVRMPIPELKSFTEARKESAQATVWRYSLGMRLLRADRLAEAQSEFEKIPPADLARLSKQGSREYAWVDSEAKTNPLDTLMNPLETTQKLISLRSAVESAQSPAGRAKASYELLSYYYEHRNLMLYNAPLWDGRRSVLFGYYELNDGVTDKADRLAVYAHAYEHECLWRARKIALALAKAYPNTPEAPQALYRAACASRRLWSFNEWWRHRNDFQDMSADAADLMGRLAKDYPTDPLAANAKKYEKVFRDEAKEQGRYALFTAQGSNSVK